MECANSGAVPRINRQHKEHEDDVNPGKGKKRRNIK
jgi:hypothetical protein